jgi:hypothetical protein
MSSDTKARVGLIEQHILMFEWTCSITRLVIEQVLQNAPHFAVF